jgi:hypothetical protein
MTLTQKVSADRIRISIILEHLIRQIIKIHIGFQTQILTRKMLIILVTDQNQDDNTQTQGIDHFYPIQSTFHIRRRDQNVNYRETRQYRQKNNAD